MLQKILHKKLTNVKLEKLQNEVKSCTSDTAFLLSNVQFHLFPHFKSNNNKYENIYLFKCVRKGDSILHRICWEYIWKRKCKWKQELNRTSNLTECNWIDKKPFPHRFIRSIQLSHSSGGKGTSNMKRGRKSHVHTYICVTSRHILSTTTAV